MINRLRWAVLASLLFLGACASSGPTVAEGTRFDLPSSNPLHVVSAGMSDVEVRKLLGQPNDYNSYTTGKNWIPFYYGSDTSRQEWFYDSGRVVFTRNRWSGTLSVIKVLEE